MKNTIDALKPCLDDVKYHSRIALSRASHLSDDSKQKLYDIMGIIIDYTARHVLIHLEEIAKNKNDKR